MSDETWQEEREECINVLRWLHNQITFMNELNKKPGVYTIEFGEESICITRRGYGFAQQEYETIACFESVENLFDSLTDSRDRIIALIA